MVFFSRILKNLQNIFRLKITFIRIIKYFQHFFFDFNFKMRPVSKIIKSIDRHFDKV